jgi:hypothetical protein
MTGTPAIAEVESLDPQAAYETEQPHEAILATCEIDAEAQARMAARLSAVKPKDVMRTGLGMAAVARKHLAQPKPASRNALLTLACTTRADAQASLDVLAISADTELRAYLIAGLRAFLEIL